MSFVVAAVQISLAIYRRFCPTYPTYKVGIGAHAGGILAGMHSWESALWAKSIDVQQHLHTTALSLSLTHTTHVHTYIRYSTHVNYLSFQDSCWAELFSQTVGGTRGQRIPGGWICLF